AVKVDEGSLTGLPEVEAEVRMTLGNTFVALGFYEEAERHLILAEALRRVTLGATDPKTLIARNHRAAALRRLGRYDESIPFFREILEDAKRVLGPEDPLTLTVMTDLAIALGYTEGIEEGEALHRKVLEVRRRDLGEDHPDTVQTLFMLGTNLWFNKRLVEAEAVLGSALDKSLAVLGDNHPDTLKVMNNLALVLNASNKIDEAESIYRRAIKNQRIVFGENHPETHRSLNNLYNLLLSQGKTEEAEKVAQERAASIRRAMDEPNLEAGTLNDFAWFLLTCQFSSVHDPETALAFAERANAMRQGKDELILDTLALALTRMQDYDRAVKIRMKLYELSMNGSTKSSLLDNELRLVEILFQKHGWKNEALKAVLPLSVKKASKEENDAFEVGDLLARAGRYFLDAGQYGEAEILIGMCLDLRKTFTPKKPVVIDTLILSASISELQEKYGQAEKILVTTLESMAPFAGQMEQKRGEVLERLVRVYEKWGKPDAAESARKKLGK
ncbi:MAG: tetratricopeptide repeat protein, partial [Planctomycetota bacterium]